MMIDNESPRRSPHRVWWILGYLVSPGLPFICLRVARAIGTIECLLGVLAGLIAHYGLVSVLTQTNGEPLQIFIVLLMGISVLSVVMWQYLAGQRSGFWSESARGQWRIAGRFCGSVIGIALTLNIIVFHLTIRANQTQAEQAVAPNRSLPRSQKSTSSVRGSED